MSFWRRSASRTKTPPIFRWAIKADSRGLVQRGLRAMISIQARMFLMWRGLNFTSQSVVAPRMPGPTKPNRMISSSRTLTSGWRSSLKTSRAAVLRQLIMVSGYAARAALSRNVWNSREIIGSSLSGGRPANTRPRERLISIRASRWMSRNPGTEMIRKRYRSRISCRRPSEKDAFSISSAIFKYPLAIW